MRPRLKMRLGDLLVHENIISSEQLDNALAAQRTSGRKLGIHLSIWALSANPSFFASWHSS